MNPFGVPVYVSDHMANLVPDWSECRSPSRAKRRHRQGHKTRMRMVESPFVLMAGKTAIMTAATLGRLKSKIEADIMKQMMGSGEAMTYTCYNEETAKLTVDMIKDAVRRLPKLEPDPLSFDIFGHIDYKSKDFDL